MLVAIVTVEQKSIWKKAGAVFACMILIFMGYQSGRQQYRFLKSQNEGMEQYMQGLVELYDYVDSHPECNYLMDSFSFSYYMGRYWIIDLTDLIITWYQVRGFPIVRS